MKRSIIVMAACLALLAGCNKAENNGQTTTGNEKSTEITTQVGNKEAILSLEQYPRVDGSTACLPLMAQVMADTCGISVEDAATYVDAKKTAQSWSNLAYGSADLLLVYEMPESVKEEIKESGVELEITPIGRDALVFIANESNPVESLTHEQIIDIYTGKVKNWSEVGGLNSDIAAFQRDTTSGSQTLFLKLMMKDIEPMDAPTEMRPGMMGGLIESIANYNNEGNAIGYSVYYYVNEMYSQPGLKLLGVDGVIPSNETIANKTYGYTNDFYVAIRKNEPEDSSARKLYQWILSENGKESLKAAGYVPIQ